MPKMSSEEIVAFLSAPGHILRLGTVTEEGWPEVVPIWYLLLDRKLYFSPRQRSGWRDNLVSNGKASLCIDTYESPARRVIVSARPNIEYEPGRDAEWRDIWWQMALRYQSVQQAIWYVTFTANEPRGLYSVDLDQADIKSWRSPDKSLGETEEGVWASNYYLNK